MNIPLDQVEPGLAKLWDAEAARGVEGFAFTVNLVAICESENRRDEAVRIARELLRSHPGRTIVAAPVESGPAAITARIDLVRDPARHGQAVGELIELDVGGNARAWLPTALERLLARDALVDLWWVGDLPDNDTLYDRLVSDADVVSINTEEMDLRDLDTLARLMDAARGAYVIADVGWARLRTWQELVARFFDDPKVLAELPHVSSLTITAAEHRRGTIEEPASTQAAMWAGWFLSRVGARTRDASWRDRSGAVREMTVPRRDGGEVLVRFATVTRSDLPRGALARIDLATEHGACFEVGREDDPRVIGWKGDCRAAVIPEAVVRVSDPDPARALGRPLETGIRDRLYEASLRAAADLARAGPGA